MSGTQPRRRRTAHLVGLITLATTAFLAATRRPRGHISDSYSPYHGREEMNSKVAHLAAAAVAAAALVAGGATAASAATTSSHASAASAVHAAIVHPDVWVIVGYYATYNDCVSAGAPLLFPWYCALTDGAHQMEALYVDY